MTWQGRGYKLGERVQYRDGYIKVKAETDDGEAKMIPESWRIWDLHFGDKDPRIEGDRVFHKNGDRTNNAPTNLGKIHFNETKFVFLKQKRMLEPFDKAWGIGRRPQLQTKSSLVLPDFKLRKAFAKAA